MPRLRSLPVFVTALMLAIPALAVPQLVQLARSFAVEPAVGEQARWKRVVAAEYHR